MTAQVRARAGGGDARSRRRPAPDPRRPPRPSREHLGHLLCACSSSRAPIRTRYGEAGDRHRGALGRCWKACRRSRNPRRLRRRPWHRPRASSRTAWRSRPPTPAARPTQVIERDIRAALDAAGYRDVRDRNHPRRRPGPPTGSARRPRQAPRLWHRAADPRAAVECPQCGSTHTEEISRFGSTPCKALWRCRTAPSRSTCSNATEMSVGVPQADRRRGHPRDRRRAPRSASTCPRNCARPSASAPASTSPCAPRSAARRCGATTRSASRPQDGELKVTVKRIAGGAFSNWVNDNLRPGAALDVMPPHGSFTWEFDPAAANHYVAFAGGSGITPIISLIKAAMSEEPQSRFTLFYGNRDSQSVIFLEELARLKNRYMDRLEIHHFLAEEDGGYRAVQRHARPRQMRRDPRASGRAGRGRRLLHLRPRSR